MKASHRPIASNQLAHDYLTIIYIAQQLFVVMTTQHVICHRSITVTMTTVQTGTKNVPFNQQQQRPYAWVGWLV